LRRDDVVQGLEYPFVLERFRVGLHRFEESGVGPCLVAEEGTKKVNHGAMILPEIRGILGLGRENPLQSSICAWQRAFVFTGA
jgi:hypothetical protein